MIGAVFIAAGAATLFIASIFVQDEGWPTALETAGISTVQQDGEISSSTRARGGTRRGGGGEDSGDSEELLPVALLRRNHAELLRVVREQEERGKKVKSLLFYACLMTILTTLPYYDRGSGRPDCCVEGQPKSP